MPRIIGVEIPGNKRVEIALQYIYGIGPAKALEIITKLDIPADLRADKLTPDQIGAIVNILQNDIVVEGDLRRMLANDIRRLMSNGSYR
ncbi:MAG: 30S ribosomal protein S13, partial [Victivallaceae bacterium]